MNLIGFLWYGVAVCAFDGQPENPPTDLDWVWGGILPTVVLFVVPLTLELLNLQGVL